MENVPKNAGRLNSASPQGVIQVPRMPFASLAALFQRTAPLRPMDTKSQPGGSASAMTAPWGSSTLTTAMDSSRANSRRLAAA